MSINPLEYVLARMKEIEPRFSELSRAEKLDDEQRGEYNRLKTDWDALDESRRDLEERQLRATAAGNINFNVIKATNPYDADIRNADPGQLRGYGLAAIDAAQRHFVRTEHGDAVTRLVERGGDLGGTVARLAVTTASPEYVEAWTRYMAGENYNGSVLQRSKDEERAMTAGTGASGGYLVPLMLDPTMVITGAGSYNPFRRISNVKQINTLTYNGATAAQVTAAFVGENAAATDNAPTLSQVQIATYKAMAYVPASFEAFEDIDALAQDVVELFSDAKDNLEATQFATGSGSAPHGVVTDVTAITASRVSPTTGGTYGVPDIYKVHQALPARYRYRADANRAWVMNVGVIDSTRQFATANNYHAFLVDLSSGQPPRLIGDQLMEASAMSASLTTGQNILLYGDFSRFLIVDRVGLSTEFIPNVFDQASGRPSGTRAWLMHWRVGSGVNDAAGFRILLL